MSTMFVNVVTHRQSGAYKRTILSGEPPQNMVHRLDENVRISLRLELTDKPFALERALGEVIGVMVNAGLTPPQIAALRELGVKLN